MIDNDIYWSALDARSGSRWPIYCVKAHQGRCELPKMPPGTMGMMVPVWKEPSANKPLLEVFNIDDTRNPYFVFFNFTDDEDDFLCRSYRINGASVEAVYNNLERIIDFHTDVVNDVLEENAQNGRSIHLYAEIKMSFRERIAIIKKIIQFAERLKSLAS
ncbi:hypothetical protein [Erwinia oleae]|uniref:hypothetical protein n=1 Tax=Erwinia oleae TaxID=796334 RepID=UPI00126A6BB0|nr:hypothetical protein [Erwinia oleae]